MLDLRTHRRWSSTATVECDGSRSPPTVPSARHAGLLAAVGDLVGPVQIDPTPQETAWTTPLDEDDEHATYDPAPGRRPTSRRRRRPRWSLAALRAPYRGRSTPVNAWWGTFDLAVSLFSGRPVDPPSNDFIMRNSATAEQIEVGWWPGDERYPRARFFAFAFPPARRVRDRDARHRPRRLGPAALGEYLLDWDDVRVAADPHRAAVEFALSAVRHACAVCGWDPALAASAEGVPPPVV